MAGKRNGVSGKPHRREEWRSDGWGPHLVRSKQSLNTVESKLRAGASSGQSIAPILYGPVWRGVYHHETVRSDLKFLWNPTPTYLVSRKAIRTSNRALRTH